MSFNTGDRVRVAGGAYGVTIPGSVGRVVCTVDGCCTRVKFETFGNGEPAYYDEYVVATEYLEIFPEDRATPRPFQVGDVVEVVKKVTEQSPDWDNSWADNMDAYVCDGVQYTVTGVTKSGVYADGYGWSPASLKLVRAGKTTPEPTPPEPTPPEPTEADIERGKAMLSEKLDTPEKVQTVLDLMGESPRHLPDGGWTTTRDWLRLKHKHWTSITFREGVSVEQDDYLHLSKCGLMVAYAQNMEKRRADVWTVTKFGRFLTKYHPELDNEAIKKMVNEFDYKYGPPPTVRFGDSEGDFIHAIKDGSSDSCMSDRFYGSGVFKFKGHVHPAAVYAAGDIEVAWLESGDRVTARALINKGTKAVSRIYGDEAKLLPQLEALGYEQRFGALNGCRLLQIDDDNGGGHIMAYVDAGIASGGGSLNYKYDDDAGYWVLSDSDGRSTSVGYEQNGVTEGGDEDDDDYRSCDRCGDGCNEDDLTYIESEEQCVCRSCLDRYYVYAQVSARGREECMPSNEAMYIECLDRYIDQNIVDELDEIIYDSEAEDYVLREEAVMCVDDDEHHDKADCVDVGTEDGKDIFIHNNHVEKEKKCGHLYIRDDNAMFWHSSDEVMEWLNTASDEGWDPDEYRLCQETTPEPTPEPTPEGPAWIDAYRTMQSAGILFSLNGSTMAGMSFTSPQKEYTIDLTQDFPDNWRDVYLKAQATGVVFEVRVHGTSVWCKSPEWLMNGDVHNYQLAPNQGGQND